MGALLKRDLSRLAGLRIAIFRARDPGSHYRFVVGLVNSAQYAYIISYASQLRHLNSRLQGQSVRESADSPASGDLRPGSGSAAQSPQLVVINTCCVTHTASAKSRHLLCQAQKHGPEAIVICGCLPTVETDELNAVGENVHVVKNRCDLAATLSRLVHTESGLPNPEHRVWGPSTAPDSARLDGVPNATHRVWGPFPLRGGVVRAIQAFHRPLH